MTTIEKKAVIEKAVESVNLQKEWGLDEMVVTFWNDRRAYFKRPGASRKYQDVGFVNMETGEIAPMNVARGFKARTESEKVYISFLEKIAKEIK